MSSHNALHIGQALIAENNARMKHINGTPVYSELVLREDQFLGIAMIMRSLGLQADRQTCSLILYEEGGAGYEMMGLCVGEHVLGWAGEQDWDAIEATRLEGIFSFKSSFIYDEHKQPGLRRTTPVNILLEDDVRRMEAIATQYPEWHRWLGEKIAELSQSLLDERTPQQPPTRIKPFGRL